MDSLLREASPYLFGGSILAFMVWEIAGDDITRFIERHKGGR